MAPAHAIDGPDAHDHATKQLAPELTIDGPQQDGYSIDPKSHIIALPEQQRIDIGVVPVDEALGLDFDHDLIVAEAVAALRREYADHPDPAWLLGECFTVLDLHRTHMAIDPATAHKDTFRRAMMRQLVETVQMETGTVGKPARQFRRVRSPRAQLMSPEDVEAGDVHAGVTSWLQKTFLGN